MKAVLISIQPYWVFLIIAKAMGWNIEKEKTVEVRKNYPKAEAWDKTAKIYCSKDKKSFDRIPKEYQPLMKPLLGKVIGEFVCDEIYKIDKDSVDFIYKTETEHTYFGYAKGVYGFDTCLTDKELLKYLNHKIGYAWHISNLVIYDKPKELSEFKKHNRTCYYDHLGLATPKCKDCKGCQLTKPPQSWCYVESEVAE